MASVHQETVIAITVAIYVTSTYVMENPTETVKSRLVRNVPPMQQWINAKMKQIEIVS